MSARMPPSNSDVGLVWYSRLRAARSTGSLNAKPRAILPSETRVAADGGTAVDALPLPLSAPALPSTIALEGSPRENAVVP